MNLLLGADRHIVKGEEIDERLRIPEGDMSELLRGDQPIVKHTAARSIDRVVDRVSQGCGVNKGQRERDLPAEVAYVHGVESERNALKRGLDPSVNEPRRDRALFKGEMMLL